MVRHIRLLIVVVLLCAATTTYSLADQGQHSASKIRILVDKVMQESEGWVAKEWMVKAAADAGFTVYSPRSGFDRLNEVAKVAKWAEKHNIDYMPWMRGTLSVGVKDNAVGKKLVWPNGSEQSLWSPNSDELWEQISRYVTEYAKLSTTNPRLIGIFLDFEDYEPGDKGSYYCYSLSYDNIIWEKFARAKKVKLPELPLKERKPWLERNDLHADFSAFQIASWRERCRALRTSVDAYNPKFKFAIYPGPGSPFIVDAAYPELATKQAPLILADPETYGRQTPLMDQAPALEYNRKTLLKNMEVPKNANIPFQYLGGIDPLVVGADPEFSGKNAVMSSQVTDGYWIFYEGPKFNGNDHLEYWKWFSWANHKIVEGDFASYKVSRQTPQAVFLSNFYNKVGNLNNLKSPKYTGEIVDYSAVTLRWKNLVVIAAQAGTPVEITLQNKPLGNYRSDLLWEIRSADLNIINSGTIPHGESGTIKFIPSKNGTYLLALDNGLNTYSVAKSNAPLGFAAGEGLSLFGGVKRFFFSVPKSLQEFELYPKGFDAEKNVRIDVFDPTGKFISTGETRNGGKEQVTLKVPVSGFMGRVWSLSITKAEHGYFADNSIKLDSRLPLVLSLRPDQVFEAQ